MSRLLTILLLCAVIGVFRHNLSAQTGGSPYLGFDRNDYPGDANLKTLHQTFSYTGYWLNNPPGAGSNSWSGHRAAVESAGFGFLVLFNGRLYAQLKTVANATRLGKSDARAAAAGGATRGLSACNDHFSRPGARRPHAARAEGLHLCVGRRRHRGRISRRHLLFRNPCGGRRKRRDRRGHSEERRHALDRRTGRSTMVVRRRRDARSRNTLPVPAKAACHLPRSGSSRNRRSARRLPGAAPITATMATAIRPELALRRGFIST